MIVLYFPAPGGRGPRGGLNLYAFNLLQRAGALTLKNAKTKGVLTPKSIKKWGKTNEN